MENNPFTLARAQYNTIGECANALAEAFSTEADVIGLIVLEFATEIAKNVLLKRQREWDALMERVTASQAKEKEAQA